MAKIKSRRKHTRDFKLKVIREVETTEEKVTTIAKRYKLHPNMIYRWRRKFMEEGVDAFPGKGKLSKKDAEQYAKDKRIRDLELENEILKKAISIFSQDPE